jgi:flagellar biosynthetic protein FliR
MQPGAPLATLYTLSFLAVFTAAGGHIAIVAGLGLGFEAVPLTAGFEALTSAASLPAAAHASLVIALATVAPVVAAALTVDLTLGAIQRALPGLPVLFLAMPLRTWAGLIVIVGTLTAFGPSLTTAVIEALP